MPSLQRILALAGLSLGLVSGTTIPTCDLDNKCPEETPCCSAYGQCGLGAYCLGGCDPRFSFDLTSCAVRPTCQNADFTFNTLDGIQSNTIYLGDATKANWVSEGSPVLYDDTVLLTMAESTVGTLLTSTHYVWYGKISATMRTSAGAGVVTAFIMMSDVKDEIDFEFVGTDLQAVQSNFYWQGTLNYTNELNITASSTNTDWHTYTVDWQEDSLTWSVDGQVLRTLNRADTINSSTGVQMYPQTPSRIMISLWPAGLASNGQGTVDWAGGDIQWNSPYMQNGYYYAQLKEVTVECASGYPSDAQVQGSKSFAYTDTSGLEQSVAVVNNSTILDSFYASGDDPTYNPDATTSKKGSPHAATASAAPTNAQTVPGVVGIVGGGVRGNTDGASGSGTTLNGGGNGDQDPSPGTTSDNTFSQGMDSNTAAGGQNERAMQGSAFAVLIAFFALVAL